MRYLSFLSFQRYPHIGNMLRALPGSGLLLLGIVVLLAGCGGTTTSGAASSDTQSSFTAPTSGTAIEPPHQLMDFTLTSQNGEPISLSDLQGKPALLYFGYTFCPDICPTTLADLVRVKRQLGEHANDVHFVMVSVDGERDTPEVLNRYLTNFDESFIGLQGDTDVLRRISPDYGLFYQKNQVSNSSAGYLIDHSTATYLIDEQGNLIMMYAYGTPPEVMSADLLTYLEQGSI